MNREQREQTWIELGLKGAIEMMDASWTLAVMLNEKHLTSKQAYRSLMSDIANEIINKRTLP